MAFVTAGQTLSDELFTIPADFEREKTKAEIEAALPLLTKKEATVPPTGRLLGKGGQLVVSLSGNSKAMIRAENWIKTERILHVLPFHEGKQRENIETMK